MKRRNFINRSLLAMGAITLGSRSAFAFQPGWKITMLTDDIGIFTEKGGTIAFHYSRDGITVVDAQFPDSASHLITELQKRSSHIRLLINTHHHGDHTAGNIAFKDLTSRVLAHENSLRNQKRVAEEQKSTDRQYFPNQTFGSLWTESAGKEEIELSYFGAGHTDGDGLIHFKHANIVHMGDLVFNRRHPYIDKSAGADISNWITVLDKAVKKFDKKTTFICGHSGDGYPVTGKADMLLAFRDYLGNLLKLVSAEIQSGKTKGEILKSTTIPGSPEWKGEGIERGLAAAYTELGGK